MLELRHLCKSYGKKAALIDFSAVLGDGIHALLGPNGAGKSTLMNIIAGNLAADSGEVLWDGRSTALAGRAFHAILGFMPQQQRLYDSFTGFEFLCYMGALKGLDRKRAAGEAERALADVNLSEEAAKRLRAYSGGMKQRILIAQAILGDPRLLILDEPTAGLDPKERIRVKNLISRLGLGKTVIIATHVVPDVESIASSVLMLRAGRLIAADRPDALCEKLAGKVFELAAAPGEIETMSAAFPVSSIGHSPDGPVLRIISDDPPGPGARAVRPTLEDVYLSSFGTEEDHHAARMV